MKQIALGNGITLAAELLGAADGEVIIPVLGITDNITDWPDAMTLPLIDAGYRVLRYELRDSGLSTHCGDDSPLDVRGFGAAMAAGQLPTASYSIADMAEDLTLLMDKLGIDQATLVGYSYGGAIVQWQAINNPQRVKSMVCLQSSNYNPQLSARSVAVNDAMAAACRVYDNEAAEIAAMTALRLATNGKTNGMSAQEAHSCAVRSVARQYYPAGTARMILSRLVTPAWHQQLSAIDIPTLVLHGTDDPIFPADHGEDLAKRIPGADLRWLDGVGHNHPARAQQSIVEQILSFVSTM